MGSACSFRVGTKVRTSNQYPVTPLLRGIVTGLIKDRKTGDPRIRVRFFGISRPVEFRPEYLAKDTASRRCRHNQSGCLVCFRNEVLEFAAKIVEEYQRDAGTGKLHLLQGIARAIRLEKDLL